MWSCGLIRQKTSSGVEPKQLCGPAPSRTPAAHRPHQVGQRDKQGPSTSRRRCAGVGAPDLDMASSSPGRVSTLALGAGEETRSN